MYAVFDVNNNMKIQVLKGGKLQDMSATHVHMDATLEREMRDTQFTRENKPIREGDMKDYLIENASSDEDDE